jgi:hypothetical protein
MAAINLGVKTIAASSGSRTSVAVGVKVAVGAGNGVNVGSGGIVTDGNKVAVIDGEGVMVASGEICWRWSLFSVAVQAASIMQKQKHTKPI